MKLFTCYTFLILLLACQSPQRPTTTGSASTAYLEEITITQLQQGYKDGKYTITAVVKDYLQRIDDIDKNGPQLNSIIYVNPDAVKQAEALDKEMAAGKIRGPMHGIPVIIKDNIDTHEMPTTAGSIALRNSFPDQDSWLVHKLTEAGAIIIAKSNLSEWANFRGHMSSSGWSGLGGQSKNPYVTDRNPCGSSSGSGVAVAANLCVIAIGTETDGSIVCPSNNNGIVGLKPTVGLISRSGIIPISFSQDTPGPMCRTVEDVAVSLGVMVGTDSSDSKTLDPSAVFHSDYTKFLKVDGLRGKRLGLLTNTLGFHDKVDTLMMQAVRFMKDQGAMVIEIESRLDDIDEESFDVLLYEFKEGVNKYFASLGTDAPIKSLDELIAFNKKDSVELRYFDQHLLEMANAKGDLQSAEYNTALNKIQKVTREEGIDKLMIEHQLDAIIAPTGSPAWKTDLVNGDHFMGGSSSLAAIAGYPSIAVPMGFVGELPVDLSIMGRAWSEPLLLQIAYAYEQGTKHRKAPEYILSD
ncbi:MAG: amidase [Bacteroidota bacterium]|nr:amidase [Bacteroidota bacterium]